MNFTTREDLLNVTIENFCKTAGKDKTEYEQLFLLFGFAKVFTLPFMLKEKREHPDFLLQGKRYTLGIEVTYAAKQSWEEASGNLSNNSNIGDSIISRSWLIGIEKRGKSLGNYLKGKSLSSWIWGSKEQVREKVYELINAIKNKSTKFLKPYFEKFDENWLLVIDKSPFLFLDIDDFMTIAAESLKGLSIPFDKVFFITQKHDSKKHRQKPMLFGIKNGILREIIF